MISTSIDTVDPLGWVILADLRLLLVVILLVVVVSVNDARNRYGLFRLVTRCATAETDHSFMLLSQERSE